MIDSIIIKAEQEKAVKAQLVLMSNQPPNPTPAPLTEKQKKANKRNVTNNKEGNNDFNILDLSSLSSAVGKENFKQKDIDKLAQLILDTPGGLHEPILTRRVGLLSYEVIGNHLGFYAAQKAREIDPIKGETVNAFVVDEAHEKAALEQLAILKKKIDPKTDLSNRDNYKPLMTEEEAIEYTKHSIFKQTFYHGTTPEGSISITTKGVDTVNFGRIQALGPGFYMTDNLNTANDYADLDEGHRIDAKVDVRNPKIFKQGESYNKLLEKEFPNQEINKILKRQLKEKLQSQGYDAMYVQEEEYLIVFEGKQVATFKGERINQ